MTEAKISLQKRTKLFALKVIKAYIEINKNSFNHSTKVLSKQFLRSGIGANCAEANFAQSNIDLRYLGGVVTSCQKVVNLV